MQDWVLLAAAITAFSTTGFIVVAVLWLRKLRQSVTKALSETAHQQIRSAEHLSDVLASVQNRQRQFDQQLQTLAQAGLRLRQEIVTVSNRLEHHQSDAGRGDSTLH